MGVTLYVMVNNRYPFTGWRTDNEAFLEEMRTRVYQERYRQRLSREVRRLLDKLLTVDEGDRMTMRQAMRNIWIVQKGRGFDATE